MTTGWRLTRSTHPQARQINDASGITGFAPHVVAERFNSMARVKVVRIDDKGGVSAEPLAAPMKAEMNLCGKLIKNPGIRDG